MVLTINKPKAALVLSIICIMLICTIIPAGQAADSANIKSFDKGLTYKPFET